MYSRSWYERNGYTWPGHSVPRSPEQILEDLLPNTNGRYLVEHTDNRYMRRQRKAKARKAKHAR